MEGLLEATKVLLNSSKQGQFTIKKNSFFFFYDGGHLSLCKALPKFSVLRQDGTCMEEGEGENVLDVISAVTSVELCAKMCRDTEECGMYTYLGENNVFR